MYQNKNCENNERNVDMKRFICCEISEFLAVISNFCIYYSKLLVMVLLLAMSSAAGAWSYVQGVYEVTDSTGKTRASKVADIQALTPHFNAGEFSMVSWNTAAVSQMNEWIDVCNDNNFRVVIYTWRYPGTYYSHEIPTEYKPVKMNPDGTFIEASGYDVCNPDAATYRANKLKDKLKLLTLQGNVYFEFNEDSLFAYADVDTPYYNSPTYSDADLAAFRAYTENPDAKFPVSITVIPPESQYKIIYAAPGDSLWNQWYDWRFRAFADYLDKVAKAVYDAYEGTSPGIQGVIYFGSNALVYEVTGKKMPAVKLDYVAESSNIDILLSETGGLYYDTAQAETAAAVFKQAAEDHNKQFGLFVQLWDWPTKYSIGLKAISTQLERNHKYQPDVVSAYAANVFLPASSYYNPMLAEFWDYREKLNQPGSTFRCAEFDWGSSRSNELTVKPAWVTSVSSSGGTMDTSNSLWRATGANYNGALSFRIDRTAVTNDVTLSIDCNDNAGSNMYVQLRDANWSVVVNNLTGNIISGTGSKTRKIIGIPLKKYPAACFIIIQRYNGTVEIFDTWLELYPAWLKGSADTGDDSWIQEWSSTYGDWNNSSSAWMPNSTENPGSLSVKVDRNKVARNITFNVDYQDISNATMYVQLLTADGTVVVSNLSGNILTGTGKRLTKSIGIPLSQYPTAAKIALVCSSVNLKVYSIGLDRHPWLQSYVFNNLNWDTSNYRYYVESAAPSYQGSLITNVDRSTTSSNNLTMILDYIDTSSSYMYVQLRDATWGTVIGNLTGDITAGTGQRVIKRIPLSLAEYPTASSIILQRYYGDIKFYPVTWDNYPAWYLKNNEIGSVNCQSSNPSIGYWDYGRSSWRVDSGANYAGYLAVRLNSIGCEIVPAHDIALTIDCTDTTGYIFAQLQDDNGNIILNNITGGNLLTGTGSRISKNITIPLSSYPLAKSIVLQRYYGAIEIFSLRLAKP